MQGFKDVVLLGAYKAKSHQGHLGSAKGSIGHNQ